jgi:hypothetical protein
VGFSVDVTLTSTQTGASVTTNPPVWGTWNFCNDGVVGTSYTESWDMPASSPVTYSVLSGSLPTGLSLMALTGNEAELTGTPTVAGTYSFTLRATNAFGSADQAFSITIDSGGGGGGGGGSFTYVA